MIIIYLCSRAGNHASEELKSNLQPKAVRSKPRPKAGKQRRQTSGSDTPLFWVIFWVNSYFVLLSSYISFEGGS